MTTLIINLLYGTDIATKARDAAKNTQALSQKNRNEEIKKAAKAIYQESGIKTIFGKLLKERQVKLIENKLTSEIEKGKENEFVEMYSSINTKRKPLNFLSFSEQTYIEENQEKYRNIAVKYGIIKGEPQNILKYAEQQRNFNPQFSSKEIVDGLYAQYAQKQDFKLPEKEIIHDIVDTQTTNSSKGSLPAWKKAKKEQALEAPLQRYVDLKAQNNTDENIQKTISLKNSDIKIAKLKKRANLDLRLNLRKHFTQEEMHLIGLHKMGLVTGAEVAPAFHASEKFDMVMKTHPELKKQVDAFTNEENDVEIQSAFQRFTSGEQALLNALFEENR